MENMKKRGTFIVHEKYQEDANQFRLSVLSTLEQILRGRISPMSAEEQRNASEDKILSQANVWFSEYERLRILFTRVEKFMLPILVRLLDYEFIKFHIKDTIYNPAKYLEIMPRRRAHYLGQS